MTGFNTAEGSATRSETARKQEMQLPGVIMAYEKDVFVKLEVLCRNGNERIVMAVRQLLSFIPVNHSITEALEVFVHPTSSSQGASEDSRSPPTPQMVLNEHYDASGVSPTQLLYNLEVLSGKLMPPTETTDNVSQIFRRNFLEAGGLKYIINILRSHSFSSSTSVDIRQDCYAIALLLAKFLLCATPTKTDEDAVEVMEEQSPPNPPPTLRQMSKSTSITVEDEVARLTIETMSIDDFRNMLSYLMRVSWAAAAGQLHLASNDDIDYLRTGVCGQTDTVSVKDVCIASESLELLVTCLKLRQNLMSILYSLPNIEQFVIDVLLNACHSDLRIIIVDYMTDLCQQVSLYSASSNQEPEEPGQAKRPRSSPSDTPHYFFLHLLLGTPTSLWQPSPRNNKDFFSWGRSTEYFEFLYRLLESLTTSEQQILSVNINKLLAKELDWLSKLKPPNIQAPEVQTLLAGHLRLCSALFTCNNVDKKPYSASLIPKLLNDFLFPASRLTIESQEQHPCGILNIQPKCSSVSARVAAYDLLVELANQCYGNLICLTDNLISMHHTNIPQNSREWEFRPLVEGRAPSGYVGLKNAGATCYMNSVLQQLYVQPGIKDMLLSAEREEEETSILPEIQHIFGHLMESHLQYYTPDSFWKKFKLEGQPINVHEHQDASEFFSSLTDQVDEALKKRNLPKVFQERFGGVFLDQIICRDGCDHTFEKQQEFTTLQLSVVQSRSLVESLQEFVRGDMLEGDNQYLCGKCEEKRDTLKRTCIKTLPSVLVVHLKRFDYDWETNREIKFNNYFEFPWELDMEPYTAEGLMSREKGLTPTPQMYELTGIIVHQGQASAGHYYAFIKDKKRPSPVANNLTTPTIPEDGEMDTSLKALDRWLRFNDTHVEEFLLTDAALESECFGGSINNTASDLHGSHPESRVRHWNAYMLFYEAVNPVSKGPPSGKAEIISPVPVSPLPLNGEDKLSQLQDLVQKGERKGVFNEGIPAEIERSVNVENLQFMQHRDVYCKEYFEFVYRLVFCNEGLATRAAAAIGSPESEEWGQCIIQLATKFLLHTYFKAYRELRTFHNLWVNGLERILSSSFPACSWFVNFMGGPSDGKYLKPFLLECPTKEVRKDFCSILGCALRSYSVFKNIEPDNPVDIIIKSLLKLLPNDIVDKWKTCAEYFYLLKIYASDQYNCQHLLSLDAFNLLIQFLLGPSAVNTTKSTEAIAQRRWSSVQAKEFGALHGTLSYLIRNTNVSSFESESIEGEVGDINPYMIPSRKEDLQPPSEAMHQSLFSVEPSKVFIHECSLTLRECDSSTTEAIASTMCYCCWNNQSFSACVIEDLQLQIHGTPPNELKSYFKVLMEILLIEDSIQNRRIQFTLIGGKYKPHASIFKVIQVSGESKRVYQGIKFLIGLANRSRLARDFILQQSDNLQTAVLWLRKKIQEYTWNQSSAYAFSNESSKSKVFQRTISAQDTLDEANALLDELEARDSRQGLSLTSGGSSKVTTSSTGTSTTSERTDTSYHENIEG